MKYKFFCPKCGNREAMDLLITTQKGKPLSLHLSSQTNIRKSRGEIRCVICKHVGKVEEFDGDKA